MQNELVSGKEWSFIAFPNDPSFFGPPPPALEGVNASRVRYDATRIRVCLMRPALVMSTASVVASGSDATHVRCDAGRVKSLIIQ